jgi:hypothetical protein
MVGDRIPLSSAFSTTTQTGPGAHPASFAVGTGSFSEVKRPGCGVNHPPHLAPRLKEEYSYTSSLLPLCAFMARYRVNFTFLLKSFIDVLRACLCFCSISSRQSVILTSRVFAYLVFPEDG